MATKNLEVLAALKALVAAAVPGAGVTGFDEDASRPTRIGGGGLAIGEGSDPGESETDLSPLTYNYAMRVAVAVSGANGAGGAAIDALLVPIGAAIEADRTLGGLCHWIEASAPVRDDRTTDHAVTVNWAAFDIIAEFSTSNPLG